MAQASRISFSEMVNGGAMRMQSAANKNQSENKPSSLQRDKVCSAASAFSNATANNNPLLRTDFIFGCFNKETHNSLFDATDSTIFSCNKY